MAKNIGYGSSLTVSTSTGTLTVGQIRTISGPGTDATDVDTTTLDSSSNYMTFVGAPIDPGELTFELAYDPADTAHKRLARDHNNLTERTFTITFNTTTSDTQAFQGYVKGLSNEIPLEDLITQEVTVKISGDPAFST